MAGDWIKMRTDLAEDPAVIDIAEVLGIDEDTVVGKLHRLWSWADSQSRDGHTNGVTQKWIDKKLHCEGFAKAMVSVQWLVIENCGISFPNFDRHNGETAKVRATATKRKQKQRNTSGDIGDSGPKPVPQSVPKMSRNERDKNETREEKRREEKEQRVPPEPRAAKLVLPDWLPPEAWADWHEFRNSRKGWTAKARELSIGTLDRLRRSGHAPRAVINQSIERGWTGLFEVKGNTNGNQRNQPSSAVERVRDANRQAGFD